MAYHVHRHTSHTVAAYACPAELTQHALPLLASQEQHSIANLEMVRHEVCRMACLIWHRLAAWCGQLHAGTPTWGPPSPSAHA